MKFRLLIILVVANVRGDHHQDDQIIDDGISSQYRSQDADGNYVFGYQESHPSGGSFRREEKNGGRVSGSYGLRNVDGRERVVTYVADEGGFRANIQSNEPGLDVDAINKASAGSVLNADPDKDFGRRIALPALRASEFSRFMKDSQQRQPQVDAESVQKPKPIATYTPFNFDLTSQNIKLIRMHEEQSIPGASWYNLEADPLASYVVQSPAEDEDQQEQVRQAVDEPRQADQEPISSPQWYVIEPVFRAPPAVSWDDRRSHQNNEPPTIQSQAPDANVPSDVLSQAPDTDLQAEIQRLRSSGRRAERIRERIRLREEVNRSRAAQSAAVDVESPRFGERIRPLKSIISL